MSTMHQVQWVTKTLDWWILPTIQRGINTDPSHTLPKNRREGSTAAHSARSAPPRCDADKGTRFTREGGTCFSPSPLLRLWLRQAQGKERVETERSVTSTTRTATMVVEERTVASITIPTAHACTHRDTDLTPTVCFCQTYFSNAGPGLSLALGISVLWTFKTY